MLYLDHNATTPVLPDALKAMTDALKCPLNPSSVHASGRKAKMLLEEARKNVAAMLGVDLRKDGYNLVFTGSGTEANNLIMRSYNRILISATEHPSILLHKDYRNNIDTLSVDENGIIKLDLLEKWLSANRGGLVSIMMANNETGVIQPIREIAKLVHKYGSMLHSDCVQVAGKIDMNLGALDVDFISISGHKFGGPAGVGALIYKEQHNLASLIIGGGQERGLRAGTENVAAIVGMGVAALKGYEHNNSLLRDLFESKITESCRDAIVFGSNVQRLPNTSMITMPKVQANQQLIAFDMEGIAVSSGSACSSGKVKASHVLKAMAVKDEIAGTAIRVSFGRDNCKEDVDKLVEAWIKIWKKQ